MTSQKRLLIKLQDVQSLRMTCQKCKASINIPLSGHRQSLPGVCPYCNEDWFLDSSSDANHVKHLVDNVRGLASRGESVACELELEIEHPE